MDSQRLIDEITELVCLQLSGAVPSAPDPTPVAPPRARILVVMGEGRRGMEGFAAQLETATEGGVQAVAVASASWPAARVASLLPAERSQVVEKAPAAWDALVRDSQAVVVPNLTVNALAGVSILAGLEPCAAAIIQALIEGRPVLAGCDELNFLGMNAAHLAKPFLDILRGHTSTVQSLGVRLVEIKALGEEVARLFRGKPVATGSGRGRNVLTREDVETLLRSGQKAIEVASGTIVTPLAREVAVMAGVEIVFR